MENNNAFRLSRIQAEGWNAARRYLHNDLDEAKIAALNPYGEELEKARWNVGFHGALETLGTK
jgi:hypothetical protein